MSRPHLFAAISLLVPMSIGTAQEPADDQCREESPSFRNLGIISVAEMVERMPNCAPPSPTDPDSGSAVALDALLNDLDDVSSRIDGLLAITDASVQRRAIYETANQWAEADPIAAYSVILAQPPGSFRDEIEGSLVMSWLAVDTTAALRFVASLEAPPAYLVSVSTNRGNVSPWLRVSPESDLVEILEITYELPDEVARSVRLQTTRRMARSDPRTAADFIVGMPLEEQRQVGLNIVRDYVSVDPVAALAWSRSLQERDVEQAVVRAMAAQDPYRMLARAASGEVGIGVSLVASGALGARDLDRARFGSALTQLPRTAASSQVLSTFTQSWLVRDQDAALEWLAASGAELPPEAILRAANRAGGDPEFAAEFAQRLQGQARSEWIENVGSRYGRQSPEQALEWLEPFRTDPAYLKVQADIVPRLAMTNGPRAAQLTETLGGSEWHGATWSVSRRWARSDPVAAVRWADGLPDSVRGPSLRAAVDEWHSYDPARAESWVLGLPQGPMREDALHSLVTAVASDGQLPPEHMLGAFSTESARQNAILGAIGMLIGRDKEGARELYENRLTDPGLRRYAETLLDPLPQEPDRQSPFFMPIPVPSDTN